MARVRIVWDDAAVGKLLRTAPDLGDYLDEKADAIATAAEGHAHDLGFEDAVFTPYVAVQETRQVGHVRTTSYEAKLAEAYHHVLLLGLDAAHDG